jgi:hypothetical protein
MLTGRVLCPDVNTLVSPLQSPSKSPIDEFYASTSATLTKIDPNFLATYGEDIAGLLFVGLISSTENYFRDILGFILSICPVAQAHAAEEKIQLGSLLWAEDQLQNRAAFEFLPFSSAENIRKAVTKFCNHKIKQRGSFDLMLEEFDKLCELRHAIVHSAHIVAGKNALKLSLKKSPQALKVRICYSDLQASGSVCTALVQSANNELFDAMVTRWATNWRNLPSWEPSKEASLLNRLHAGFLSVRDYQNKSIPNGLSKHSLKTRIKTDFNL